MMTAVDPGASVRHLLGRARVIEDRVRALITARRAVDPQPDDPFRGLYLSDELVDRLLGDVRGVPGWSDPSDALARCEQEADLAETRGARLRLREVADTFSLTSLDVELLLIAIVADLDPRFEQLFGYLNDDVTRRRPSVALAFDLCGVPLSSAVDRSRLAHGPLVTSALVTLDDPDRPFPSRAIRVPDRVVGHLLGDDTPDAALAAVLRDPPDYAWGDTEAIVRSLDGGQRLFYFREPPTGSGTALAVAALTELGIPSLVVDLDVIPDDPDVRQRVVREAGLRGCGIVARPVTAETRPATLAALITPHIPTVLVGEAPWDPAWAVTSPLLIDVPNGTVADRVALWQRELGSAAEDVDLAAVTPQFRLRPEQVHRAASGARVAAGAVDGRINTEHVRAASRAQNGTALDRLARHIVPGVGWGDLVLPDIALRSLEEVTQRARFRDRVLGEWRMRPGGGRGTGVVALFAGDSGTGKTMSAEVVASELGLDLYVVDLSSVVDKYVGETEKNLERIFTAAAGVNGVLLFDEADAVFGKRSEVKDAHDRYANVESAYLLQRMETFDGLAVLATNLRANIDDAFTRRLDVVVDFPLPDANYRSVLWDRSLGTRLERAADIDLTFLGKAFELAGGAIRAAAVSAAYLAAADAGVVTMSHLIAAVHQEYRKLGRLTLESEFGPYWSLVTPRPT